MLRDTLWRRPKGRGQSAARSFSAKIYFTRQYERCEWRRQGLWGAYFWLLWRGRTNPCRRGASEAPRSEPRDQGVEVLRSGWCSADVACSLAEGFDPRHPAKSPRDRAHSSEECPYPWVRPTGARAHKPGSPFQCYCRRRDREWTDPRQLRQLRWRSARAGPLRRPSLAVLCLALGAKFAVSLSESVSSTGSFRFDCLGTSQFEFRK